MNGKGKSLLDRVQPTCTPRGISLIKYICNEDYANKVVREQKMFTYQDGLVDKIRFWSDNFDKRCGQSGETLFKVGFQYTRVILRFVSLVTKWLLVGVLPSYCRCSHF